MLRKKEPTGTIKELHNHYYMDIRYYDNNGKRCRLTRSTGLKVRTENGGKYKNHQNEARNMLAEALAMLTPKKGADMMFADVCRAYLDKGTSELADTTRDTYYQHLTKLIIPFFEANKVSLGELEAEHIQDFINKEKTRISRNGRRVSGKTIRNEVMTIGSVLTFARSKRWTDRNVMEYVVLPKIKSPDIRPLSESTLSDWLDYLSSDKNGYKEYYIPAVLGVYCGLRRAEALGLTWDNVSLDEKQPCVWIKQTLCESSGKEGTKVSHTPTTKTVKSQRVVPLCPAAADILRAWKQEQEELYAALDKKCGEECRSSHQDYVCTDLKGNWIRPNRLSENYPEAFNKAKEDSQVTSGPSGGKRHTYHALRHTFASLMMSIGEDPNVVKELLGHSSIRMTLDTYTHAYTAAKVRAVRSLGKRIAHK